MHYGGTCQQQQEAPPFIPLQHEAPTKQFPEASSYANTNLTYKIIDAPKGTFCYDVYAGGRLMIHQTSTTGLPGNVGFRTKDDVVNVAELVIGKLRKGEMPPTISINEMHQLNVRK